RKPAIAREDTRFTVSKEVVRSTESRNNFTSPRNFDRDRDAAFVVRVKGRKVFMFSANTEVQSQTADLPFVLKVKYLNVVVCLAAFTILKVDAVADTRVRLTITVKQVVNRTRDRTRTVIVAVKRSGVDECAQASIFETAFEHMTSQTIEEYACVDVEGFTLRNFSKGRTRIARAALPSVERTAVRTVAVGRVRSATLAKNARVAE